MQQATQGASVQRLQRRSVPVSTTALYMLVDAGNRIRCSRESAFSYLLVFLCLFLSVTPSSRDSEEYDDYDDEEEDDRQRRVSSKRRREEDDLRRNRTREKRRRYEDEDGGGDRGRRLKGKLLKYEDRDKRRRLKRTGREEEGVEHMGRGKRRDILSQQRRKRLAQMLKKRRPSTDDEDDEDSQDSQESEESEESESSSEEDRPVRKRLNRIDSDDEDEEELRKSSAAEQRANSDAQVKARGRSLSPSNAHRTSRRAESPVVPRDKAASDRPGRHKGPLHPEEDEAEDEEESVQTDSLNSEQNSPQS